MATDDVEAFLDAVPDEHRPTVDAIRTTIFDVYPDATETIKWNKPIYDVDGVDRFYVDHYTEHVSLGFMQGASLEDPDGKLEGTGKSMRHVKFGDPEEVADPAVRSLVEDAV